MRKKLNSFQITNKAYFAHEGERKIKCYDSEKEWIIKESDSKILNILVENRNKFVTLEKMANIYWENNNYEGHDPLNLRKYIKRLKVILNELEGREVIVSGKWGDESYKLQTESFSARDYPDKDIFSNKCIDFRRRRCFASCGSEDTVFKMSQEGDRLDIEVNFEPTRIRKNIPEYAGVYFIFSPAFVCLQTNALQFEIWGDSNLSEIQVEIKPTGRKWMHEIFSYNITEQPVIHEVEFKDFEFPQTASCIEEITFVVKPSYFKDDNNLSGVIHLRGVEIK